MEWAGKIFYGEDGDGIRFGGEGCNF